MSNRGMVILHDPHEKQYEPLDLSKIAKIDTTIPVFKLDVSELFYEGIEMVYIVEKDDANAPKYRLAILNFDDSPDEPIRVLDFPDQSVVGDYIVPPYLTVNPQELVNMGIDRLYVTSVKQYCPISSPEQEDPRITFADRLKFSKFTKELSDESKQLRELSEIMLKCIVDGEKRRDCWSCPAHKQFDELRWYCCIKDEAAKLGIGVDA